MSKVVLLATEKPFSAAARNEVVAIIEKAGYTARVLESYKGKAPLIEAIADADAAIVRSDIIDAEVLGAAKKLKLVVRAGAGYDNIDTATAKTANIAVQNTPGQNANAVAELVFGMLVYSARGKFNGKTGSELRGKTIGLHAYGAVGRAVAAIAKGFGLTVLAHDPFVKAEAIKESGAEAVATVEELYKRSDIISLHVPATAETKGSIGKKLLSLLPKGGTVVNTARKEIHQRGGAARGARGTQGSAVPLGHRAERRHEQRSEGEVRGPHVRDLRQARRSNGRSQRQRRSGRCPPNRRFLRAQRAQLHRQRRVTNSVIL